MPESYDGDEPIDLIAHASRSTEASAEMPDAFSHAGVRGCDAFDNHRSPIDNCQCMKILHLITRLILGGAQENTVLSCEGQHADGHEVTLAFGPIYGPEGSLLERAQASGTRCEMLPAMKRAVDPLADLRCYRQCCELIERLKPEVVHTHSSKAGIVGRFAAWKTGVPCVIHTIHGLPFHPYQSWMKNRLYIASERAAARRCHRIVCVADAMTRQALAAGVGRAEQYATIYSGMEVDRYSPLRDDRADTRRELGLGDGDFVIGTVARLAELKGHDDLLDVLPDLLARHPNVRYLWVGDGWWRERLAARIDAMGLAGRVVLTGLVPPDRVPRYLRAMDLLAHPSYREGLPRTVPQALLCGTAVAAYDGDGAGEACIDGRTGRLVPTGDVKALGQALTWMIEHDDQRRAWTEAGRALCATRFDHHTMVNHLEALYRQVLSESSSAR